MVGRRGVEPRESKTPDLQSGPALIWQLAPKTKKPCTVAGLISGALANGKNSDSTSCDSESVDGATPHFRRLCGARSAAGFDAAQRAIKLTAGNLAGSVKLSEQPLEPNLPSLGVGRRVAPHCQCHCQCPAPVRAGLNASAAALHAALFVHHPCAAAVRESVPTGKLKHHCIDHALQVLVGVLRPRVGARVLRRPGADAVSAAARRKGRAGPAKPRLSRIPVLPPPRPRPWRAG